MAALHLSVIVIMAHLTPNVLTLSCYTCKEDCAKNILPVVQCNKTETACVTYEIDRFHVIRGCYSDSYVDFDCSIESMARFQCKLCTEDRCNIDLQEPLICRVCDWTYDSKCEIRQRCHVPFGTHHVYCYIVYHRLRGFNYGCTHEAPADVETILNEDKYHMVHMKCDGHDCNDEIRFLKVDKLFEPYRMCYGCYLGDCGQITCPDPFHKYGMFCYKDITRDVRGCMSNLTDYEIEAGFEGRAFIHCHTNWCNDDRYESNLVCNDQQGFGRYCSTREPKQQCVSYWGKGVREMNISYLTG